MPLTVAIISHRLIGKVQFPDESYVEFFHEKRLDLPASAVEMGSADHPDSKRSSRKFLRVKSKFNVNDEAKEKVLEIPMTDALLSEIQYGCQIITEASRGYAAKQGYLRFYQFEVGGVLTLCFAAIVPEKYEFRLLVSDPAKGNACLVGEENHKEQFRDLAMKSLPA